MAAEPNLPLREYRDLFGNVCTRVLTPAGTVRFSSTFEILDSGRPDELAANARQHSIDELPDDALIYLLGSKYCDTQKLSDFAWRILANLKTGWDLVQTICNFVHEHIKFDYAFARDDRTAFEAYQERVGVCRDFTHLAVALCRCMNIPARYCTGYLGDIGVPPDPGPMDFLVHGSKYSWKVTGFHSMRGTIVRALDVLSLLEGGMRRMWRFQPALARRA
jgi:transglutaminase-like putative cysteine protease